MKILEWEEQIKKRLNFIKTQDFESLKNYLVNVNYYPTFTPSEVSEGVFFDEEFYAGFIFDEKEILKRDVQEVDSGWKTTIILLASIDGENILDYHIVGLNDFSRDELRKFIDFSTKSITENQDEV